MGMRSDEVQEAESEDESQSESASIRPTTTTSLVEKKSRSRRIHPEEQEEERQEENHQSERMWCLDYARFLCIFCVVTEHSGGSNYTDANIFYVQQWVVPYLYTISGFSFMFSRGALLTYLGRLTVVFVVGVSANWLADISTGRDWRNDFANTIFQMAYVVMVMGISIVGTPLKRALIWRCAHPRERIVPRDVIAWTVLWGVLASYSLLAYTSGHKFNPLEFFASRSQIERLEGSGWTSLMNDGLVLISEMASTLFICLVACCFGRSDWFPWVLLVIIYTPRWVIPYDRGGHPVLADLFGFGMIVKEIPLHGTELLKKLILDYGLLLLAPVFLCGMPTTTGRCDLHPLGNWWERLRFASVECVLVVLLVSGALNTSDSLNLSGWLNTWALYAYCFHVAWARVFVVPYGAVITYAAIPAFCVVYRLGAAEMRQRKLPLTGP